MGSISIAKRQNGKKNKELILFLDDDRMHKKFLIDKYYTSVAQRENKDENNEWESNRGREPSEREK